MEVAGYDEGLDVPVIGNVVRARATQEWGGMKALEFDYDDGTMPRTRGGRRVQLQGISMIITVDVLKSARVNQCTAIS